MKLQDPYNGQFRYWGATVADNQYQAVLFFTSHLTKSLCDDQAEKITRMENTAAQGSTKRGGRGVKGRSQGRAAEIETAVEMIDDEEEDESMQEDAVEDVIVDEEKESDGGGIFAEAQHSERNANASNATFRVLSSASPSSSAAAARTAIASSAADSSDSVAMANARPRRTASKVVHYIEDDVEDVIDDTDFVLEVNNQRRRDNSTKRRKASAKAKSGTGSQSRSTLSVTEVVDSVHGWVIYIKQISVMRPRYSAGDHLIMFLVRDAEHV